MQIVDAQVHIWNAGTVSPHHATGRPDPFRLEDLLVEMEAAGIYGAVLAPPTWDPTGNAPSLEAARLYPDRFAVTGNIDWQAPADRALLRGWRSEPGMYGLRLSFNTPEKQAFLTNGSLDWVWEEAERAELPVMVLIPGGVPHIGRIAERFPGLRVCVDHLGIPRGAKNAAAFEHLPDLLALARLPGVSVKAGGLPTYSTIDAYPYPSLHGHLRRVYDAFGPERIFWATDLSRMTCDYREVVTMFTEGLSWLSEADKQLIMGGAVRNWLGWTTNRAAEAQLRQAS